MSDRFPISFDERSPDARFMGLNLMTCTSFSICIISHSDTTVTCRVSTWCYHFVYHPQHHTKAYLSYGKSLPKRWSMGLRSPSSTAAGPCTAYVPVMVPRHGSWPSFLSYDTQASVNQTRPDLDAWYWKHHETQIYDMNTWEFWWDVNA